MRDGIQSTYGILRQSCRFAHFVDMLCNYTDNDRRT